MAIMKTRKKKNAGGLSPGHSLVWVTFPAEDKELVRQAAKAAGMKMSVFSRRIVLAAAQEMTQPPSTIGRWLEKVLHPPKVG